MLKQLQKYAELLMKSTTLISKKIEVSSHVSSSALVQTSPESIETTMQRIEENINIGRREHQKTPDSGYPKLRHK